MIFSLSFFVSIPRRLLNFPDEESLILGGTSAVGLVISFPRGLTVKQSEKSLAFMLKLNCHRLSLGQK